MDRPRTLPVPDETGVYGYPAALLAAHQAWLDALADQPDILEVAAAHAGTPYRIARRRPQGPAVLVIEPHHDDFVLCASGTLLARPAPLTVVTVFSRSRSVHPSLESAYPTVESVSQLRAEEGRLALLAFGATRHLLGHQDAEPPHHPFDRRLLAEVIEQLRPIVAQQPDAVLLAPAGVTRHPDHLLVHEAAKALGCRWFWEDIGFWPSYAMNVADQALFEQRTGGTLSATLVDVTDVILDKLTLLHLHASQMQPAAARYRPLRHAWALATSLSDPAALYAERHYHLAAPGAAR